VLVTRPQPDAARTAAKLAQLGHEPVMDPLLTIEPITIGEIPAGPFAALAATSANAARIAGALVELDPMRVLPLYAVGTSTAEAAHAAGFETVIDADGDAAALAKVLMRDLRRGARVLHLAGEERARELGTLIADSEIFVDVLVLYRVRAADALGPAAEFLASGGIDAVLHFSPRSAAAFAAVAEREGLVEGARKARHLCLSLAVAARLASLGVRAEVAARPNEAALLALLKS